MGLGVAVDVAVELGGRAGSGPQSASSSVVELLVILVGLLPSAFIT
jgi:hypothetical protein